MAEPKQEQIDSFPEKGIKAPNVIERVKEEVEAIIHTEKSPNNHHHKETHGRSNDIDENTPIESIKGPSVFERAKEEIEALVEAIHPKKEEKHDSNSSKKEGGFFASLGKSFEKVCHPSHKKE